MKFCVPQTQTFIKNVTLTELHKSTYLAADELERTLLGI